MRATLKFDLLEERDEFETAVNGWKYRSVLWDLDNFLRSKLKYEELNDSEYVVYEKIREQLWNLLNEDNLTLH